MLTSAALEALRLEMGSRLKTKSDVIMYSVGLDKIQEAVVSSHFMHRFSNDKDLSLYSDQEFSERKIQILPEFVFQKILPDLVAKSDDFCVNRADLAKLRAAENFKSYGLDEPGQLKAAHYIAEVMFDKSYSKDTRKFYSRHFLAEQVAQHIAAGSTMCLAIPALPFKLPSPLKSRGSSPDLAEANFLLQLYEIARSIDLLYREARPDMVGHLAQFTVVSDGSRFSAIVGEDDATIKRYRWQLDKWIEWLGIGDWVRILDYQALLEGQLASGALAAKSRIRGEAETHYAGIMWPVFDPMHAAKSVRNASAIEPDPEKLNPRGRFGSLLHSLVYTIKYQALERVEAQRSGCFREDAHALYHELTAHLFDPYPGSEPCSFSDVLLEIRSGKALSLNALEHLRQEMFAEAWRAAIHYLAEIKSDRDLEDEPIAACLPGCFRWTIHAKRGQLAIATPSANGITVQAWAGSAVFKRANGDSTKLCSLPVIALEGVGAIPVTVKDNANIFGLGDQPLFYIYPDISDSSRPGLLDMLTGSLTRTRAA